ncbi:MAG TPA: SPASM domain-containing protein, partial [Patescibacteria group bacterium]|nr:SPASM domain-containing protein [Patescibacteria group bacterium]
SELKDTLKKIAELKKENKLIRCSDHLLFLVDNERMDLFKNSPKKNISGGCIAGVSTLYIKSNGDVLICPFVKFPISNISNENIKNIWFNNNILTKLRNRENLTGKCKECIYRSFCGGCRGASLSSSGSLFGSDPNCWLTPNQF